MRAITVRQPFAHLIAIGVKPIENRTWCPSYRGPLLIHASKAPPDEDDIADAEDKLGRRIARHRLELGASCADQLVPVQPTVMVVFTSKVVVLIRAI
jgi:hypothetical protein